jgi:hypothetical protein
LATAARPRPAAKKPSKKSLRDRKGEINMEEIAYQAPPPVDASDEDKADYVVARYAVQDEHYRGLYQQWIKVLLFLVGKQWLKWNEQLSSFQTDDDVPPWRQQPVTNWTYAFFRAMRAKLTKNRPSLEVVPPSSDSEDREAAKLGEAVLEFLWRHLKSPQKVMRAIGWFVCTGNVFFDVSWDEAAGRAMPRTVLVEIPNESHDPSDPASQATVDVECACDEDGEAYRRPAEAGEEPALDGGEPYDLEREPDVEPEGEVDLNVDDPFSVRFNPDAPSPEEANEWFITKLWPKQKVIAAFNLDDDEEFGLNFGSDGDASGMREEYEDVMSRAAAAAPEPFQSPWSGIRGSDQSTAIGDRILVIYYFRKPDEYDDESPEGRHFIVAGRKKVWPPCADDAKSSATRKQADASDDDDDEDEDSEEYPNGEAPLPFGFWPPRIAAISTPVPGQPQGIGPLTQIVGLNEQYNYLDGKIAEKHVIDSMGGVWFVGPGDKGIQITSEPGQVKISKEMGAKGRAGAPFQAALQALPEPVYREREVCEHKMQSIGGVSQVDLSQRPEGVTAGRAFLVLQEASDSAVMPDLLALEEALEEIGRRELVIVQQKYTETRTIRIRGDKGGYEFRSFKGADLRDGLDVRVQVGSSFPWSKSAQFDSKISVLTAFPGLVADPQTGKVDREAFAKYMDTGATGLSGFESDEDPDMVEFDREIALFEAYDPERGSLQLPQLGPWMNIPVKQKLCYDFMKRDFSRFQRWTPDAQKAFFDWMMQLTVGVQRIVDMANPQAPGGTAGGDQASDQLAPPDAAGGAGAPPGGAPPTKAGPGPQLVPPGGELGKQNTPIARHKQSQMQLTRGDLASAGPR